MEEKDNFTEYIKEEITDGGSYLAREQDLKRFNWGAFLLAPIWALCYGKVGLGLLMVLCNITRILIPVTLIFSIYIGFQANRIAWDRYRSLYPGKTIDDMLNAQKPWLIWSLIIAGISFIIGYLEFLP
jgi:hypothetical protein